MVDLEAGRCRLSRFDFDAYRDAVEGLDAERWLAFYAETAEWLEYRHANPPRTPHVMRGITEIGAFVRELAAAGIALSIEREVVGEVRAAYMLTAALPDGRRVVENVIVDHRDGLITRQVDVEAWD